MCKNQKSGVKFVVKNKIPHASRRLEKQEAYTCLLFSDKTAENSIHVHIFTLKKPERKIGVKRSKTQYISRKTQIQEK